jgi:intracellular multiplication protein IcmL
VDQTKKDTGKEAVANEALAGEGLSAKEALAGEGLSEKEALVGEGLFEKEALVDEGLFDKEALAGEGLFDKEALAGEGLSAKEALAGEGLFDKEALAGEGLLNLEEAFKEFLIEMRRKLTTEKEEAGTNDNAAATAPDVNEAALEGMGTLDDEYSDSLINEEVSAPDEASDDEDIDDYSWVFDRLKEGRVGPEELEQVWDDDDDVIIVPVDGTEGSLAEEIDDVPPPPLPMPTPVAVVTQAEVTSSAALCKAAEGGRTGEADEAEAGEHGAGLVIESRNWHLGQNRRLFKVLMFLCPILLVSLLLNAWQVVARPEPRYFAVTRDLRIIEMPPLSEPVVESKSLTNWAGDVVIRALSLNFLTWRQTLSDLRGEFDPGGFESFMSSLKSGGHLEKIEKERLSLSALISGAPVVTMSAVKGGVMTWKMEMPLVLSYESSTGVVASQKLLAEVVVQRTETSRNPRGVVIRQIVLTKAG